MKDYAVYRVHRDNHDKEILFRDLTKEEAMSLVQNAPKEKDSMVVFDEMPRNMLWGRS
jgi:predicted DCC family thiol-disulfide oxidoreductase YuxK